MYLNNYYYYFKNAFDDRFCQSVKDLAKKNKIKKATVDNSDKQSKEINFTINKKLRDSEICWLNDQWIYDSIQPYMEEANKMADWNFDLSDYEDLQFTSYKKNQHYDWHLDNLSKTWNAPNNPTVHGKYRKLSFSINLSDPKDFKGGEFYFEFLSVPENKIVECKELKEKGTIIFFPSFVKHRVAPVTEGKRNALVGWNLGYPFK